MNLHWNHLILNNVPTYSLADFRFALWIMPIGFVISIVLSLLIKETHCHLTYNEK
jgi:hypothetical protein